MAERVVERRAALAWQAGRASGMATVPLVLALIAAAGLGPLVIVLAVVLVPAPVFAVMVAVEALVLRLPRAGHAPGAVPILEPSAGS